MAPPLQSRKLMYPDKSESYLPYMKTPDINDIFEKLHKPKEFELAPRTTFLKLDAVTRAKGSAYMEYGNTKILATIEPLREIAQPTNDEESVGLLICSVKYASFAVYDTEHLTRKENLTSLGLKKALEPMICLNDFPNFELEIKILVIDDDGCALSTAINCCCAALVDAGIPVFDLMSSSTVCLYKDIEFVNPTAEHEQLLAMVTEDNIDEEYGIVMTSSLAAVSQVCECFHKGYFGQEKLQRLIDHSLELNKFLRDMIATALLNKINKQIAESAAEETEE